MKLPLEYIAVLIILSLADIFSYQAYWLGGLYRTMRNDMERSIIETMRMGDHSEMTLCVEKLRRNNTDHGEVSISTGFEKDGVKSKVYVHNTASIDRNGRKEQPTIRQVITHNATAIPDSDSVLFIEQREGRNEAQWLNPDATQKKPEAAVKDTGNSPKAALRVKGGLDMILRDQNSMLKLTAYFQRGLHSGLDVISNPGVHVYDNLLTLQLKKQGIALPHRLEHIYTNNKSSPHISIDTLAIVSTAGHAPGPEARQYSYAFDLNTHRSYRLWMEPITQLVLKQMWGILATSFVILIVLSFSLWILIRAILRQKTLEEMKNDFTNNITHEPKTPVTVVYATNDVLLNFSQTEEKTQRDKYLCIYQEQLQWLNGLVEQVLSMNTKCRKTFHLRPEVLSMADILEPLIEQHKLRSEEPVHISTKIESTGLTLTTNHTHFSSIISNLIGNTIKYSYEEAEISICCRQITFSEQGDCAETSISDRGIGTAPEKQKRIFDKFHHIPTGNLHDVKGYGLDLFYIRTIAEKHGGSVSMKSEPGEGSTFTIGLSK